FQNFLSVGVRFFRAWRIATPSASPAHAASHVRTAESSPVSIGFFIGKQDAINEGIGALRGRDGFRQSLFAAVVDAIGEDDDGLAAWLLFHQFVGGQEDRVIEQCAATAPAVRTASASSAAARGATAATRGATLRELRRVNLIDGRLQFLAGSGEVLKERNFPVELNDKGLVLVHAQNLIEKSAAGRALLIDDASLAHAGVHQ